MGNKDKIIYYTIKCAKYRDPDAGKDWGQQEKGATDDERDDSIDTNFV